jgi:hypothetical protein
MFSVRSRCQSTSGYCVPPAEHLGFEDATLRVRSDVQSLFHYHNQAAIIALFRVMNRYVGNLPPMPGSFPTSGTRGA